MALNQAEVYTCESAVQVEVLVGNENACSLTCCGKPMTKLEEKTADAATEKHVPVVEKVDGGVKVAVGSTLHPMVEDHYIEWIEVRTANRAYKAFLKPGDAPEATFKIDEEVVYAREHCNKHGLWRA